ncbi:dTDP-4-dehydrorhamnose reductase [Kordiimonas sp.]|uniref:dTDP-4-dehydrorhamnose reductase n=1 Tax=Kordiimonas sp. TaxID=1970157 RepID=UPI003A945A97
MRVFVAGKSGQLARALVQLNGQAAGSSTLEISCFGRPDFDLASLENAHSTIAAFKPDAIINAAAYTAVDAAEDDEENAFLINAVGAENLAKTAATLNVPFLHVSTDYVFDGEKDGPYTEQDAPNPQGAYGRSKLEGEVRVMIANPRSLIFRTAWVYSPFGKNFVKTMLGLAEKRDELGVVADQVGNPTYAPDIAAALLAICHGLTETPNPGPLAGLYHLAGTGTTSWHGFAEKAFELGAHYGHPVPRVGELTTAEYPTAAKRPANSRLDCSKLRDIFGITLPHWHHSLERCVTTLLADK